MGYDVQMHRLGISAVFDLKGEADALVNWAGNYLPEFPERANTLSRKARATLAYIGHQHWLLRAPITQEETLIADLRPESAPPDISVVRVSDTLTFFQITGPDADQIMSVACPLDLDPSVFEDDTITYSEVFQLKALIQRISGGFEFAVEQSFGDFVADYLGRATA